jgi:ribosomal protein S18 acetylase RimI-like enzyme
MKPITEVAIRKYRGSDRASFVRLMEELQDYLVAIDDLKRMRRMPEFGESYTKRTLEKVAKNNGIIYVAEREGRIIGFVVGIMPEQTKEELLELIPSKRGNVLELVVENRYRRKGVGRILMESIENYSKQNDCSVLGVEVFSPNKNAYLLYSKLGYRERTIWMTKKL